jgi:hypothetical protein
VRSKTRHRPLFSGLLPSDGPAPADVELAEPRTSPWRLRGAMVLLASMMTAASLNACGGSRTSTDGATTPTSTAPKEGADAGAADAAAGAERPFAGSATEATQLISAAIDKREAAVNKCVREYRVRKNLPHERVELSVGIDQHGRVLGVTLKKKQDAELSACVQEVLKTAPFPRSNTGVITVTKSYEEIVQ